MSPSIPQYSFSNTGSQSQPTDYTMSYGAPTAPSPAEITASTISATTSLSGGKLQYTPQQPSQPPNQPQPNIPQILGMLQQALLQQGNIQSNPATSAPAPVQQNPPPQNPPASATASLELNRLLQTLQQSASAGNAENRNFNQNSVSQSDPSLQQTQNQDMPSLGSLDNVLQNYMGDGEMVSFESFGSMSGAMANIDFVAQYETVDESSRMSTGTRTEDETMAAINNLSQS